MPKKAKSKAQARFLGFIAGGGKPKGGEGLTAKKAGEMLRGTKMGDLPARKKKKKSESIFPSLTELYFGLGLEGDDDEEEELEIDPMGTGQRMRVPMRFGQGHSGGVGSPSR